MKKKSYALGKGLLALLAMMTIAHVTSAQVGINTQTPDASAVLDVKSTTQGMLVPRMNKAQRDAINMVSGVSTPATGLLVYQTDNTPGFYFYNGTVWTTLNSVSGQELSNGTTGGQVYLTAAASPYAPQNPQTLTGDISLSATGIATIADSAVTSSKIANGAVTTTKLSATGTASETTYLRGDGSWATPSGNNTSVYAAKKTTGISLYTSGEFPTGFKAVNFLAAERTVGQAALFTDLDYTYTIPSDGVYHIGFTFRYGIGLQAAMLANSPGPGILRTRAGVATIIDSRSFMSGNLILLSLTISEESLNSLYTLQAGDKISLGLIGSQLLDSGLLGASKADFFIYKVN
jgi:hypothetical protein